jgi:GrpB-like predicted nucleotidyltransferase (UPF0157 family)
MIIGQHKHDLAVVPHQPGWIDLYQQEARLLRNTLGERAIQIKHIGSTAIPGMAAKPIIDMMVAIASLTQAQELIPVLETIGYIYRVSDPVPERMFFAKESKPEYRTHHLNLTEFRSVFWRNQILFRDYLRKHQEMANTYVVLKQALAKESAQTNQIDREGKTAFVTQVLAMAEKEKTGLQ